MAKQVVTIEFVEHILNRDIAWVGAADAKVGPLLAIATAMLGTLAAFVSRVSTLALIPVLIMTATALLLLLCLTFLGLTVFPRLRGPADSLIYFGSVASIPENSYLDRLSKLSTDEIYTDLARQCYRNAKIAMIKHKAITRAMACLIASILPWVVSLWQLWQLKAP